jgi:hypothetical protein
MNGGLSMIRVRNLIPKFGNGHGRELKDQLYFYSECYSYPKYSKLLIFKRKPLAKY